MLLYSIYLLCMLLLYVDNCAMWLNGLNDNLPGFPKVQCTRVPCPVSYMELDAITTADKVADSFSEIPEVVLESNKYKTQPVGPFGSNGDAQNQSYIINDMCVTDGIYSINRTLDDHIVSMIGLAMLNAYDGATHGQFFWNFRTELEEKWDFQRAVANKWLPRYSEMTKEHWNSGLGPIKHACTLNGQMPVYNHSKDVMVTLHFDSDVTTNSISMTTILSSMVIVGLLVVLVRYILYSIEIPGVYWVKQYFGYSSHGYIDNTRHYEPIPDSETELVGNLP